MIVYQDTLGIIYIDLKKEREHFGVHAFLRFATLAMCVV